MALFSRTKKNTEEKAVAAMPHRTSDYAHVLLNPRITEKATFAGNVSAYVFDVATSANKKEIASAVKAAYSVTPRAVRIVNIRPKMVRNMRTGKRGMKQGGKKAYVYLKKGETITLS
jgi:large subunit ribosomal protein L23